MTVTINELLRTSTPPEVSGAEVLTGANAGISVDVSLTEVLFQCVVVEGYWESLVRRAHFPDRLDKCLPPLQPRYSTVLLS